MQSRLQSGIAAVGTVLTIVTAVLASLQTSGYIQPATDAQQRTASTIATVIGILLGAAVQIYSHYNNPTSKNNY